MCGTGVQHSVVQSGAMWCHVMHGAAMCLQRHATSKIRDGDLVNINYLGFRGEAIPSIGSIADISIDTYDKITNESWKISIINNILQDIEPSIIRGGTKVTIRDLFSKVPARLKFLKTNPI